MHNVSAAFLEEAFIAPIRFALLVDDQFPVYSKIAETHPAPAQDSSRAVKLFNFCRARGWLCDVDNAAAQAQEIERVSHLHQSDLLVLDFHLDPARPEDPTLALRILQKLAASEHFNLVVIYTAADPASVVKDVAFSLGAGTSIGNVVDAKTQLEELDPAVSDSLSEGLNEEIIINFLQGKNPNASANALRTILSTAGTRDGRLQRDVINLLCERYLERRVTKPISAARLLKMDVHGSFEGAPNAHWVTQGNVFAVVVNKSDDPAVLVERLTAALVAWNPPVLVVMMVHARAALERAGRLPDKWVLDSQRRQAGWLLRVLLGETPEERKNHLGELYARLFGRLIRNVSSSIADFGSRLIEPVAPNAQVSRAMSMANGAGTLDDVAVFHALNEHLCSDTYTDGAMTTGVVFRTQIAGHMKYWVCTSPACDLVPGQKLNGWDADLHPLRPITAARLTWVKDIGGALKTATHGRHIFLFYDEKPIALEVIDAESRQMRLEILFLEMEGRIADSRFKGCTVQLNAEKSPITEVYEFQVVGVLRSDYANRFLTDSGYQRARIGVDFVNHV